jgi:hypothetical protein
MKFLLIGVWVAVLTAPCTPLNAHPGDNGYWLIEVGSTEVRSRVLLPDHVLMHLLGPNQDGDRDPHPPDLMSSRDEIAAILSDHLRLKSQPALVQNGSSVLRQEPGGFLELVTVYGRPAGTRKLTAAYSLQELYGGASSILCRVIGGKPESFMLDSRTAIVEIKLSAPGMTGRASESSWMLSGYAMGYGLLFLSVLGLAFLCLKLIRNRQRPGRS